MPRSDAVAVLFLCVSLVLLAGTGCSHSPKELHTPQVPQAFNRETPQPLPSVPLPTSSSYTVKGQTYYVLNQADGYSALGRASYYGRRFHGRKTASGERYNMHQYTAAHRTLPFGSLVKVTNLKNKRWVIVQVNDRGPFGPERIIDVSYAAAKSLGILKSGTTRVMVEGLKDEADIEAGTTGLSTNGIFPQ